MAGSADPGRQDFGGVTRSPMQKAPVLPSSLAQTPAWATPLERSALLRAGRSNATAASLGSTPTKVRSQSALGRQSLHVLAGACLSHVSGAQRLAESQL